MEATPLQRAAGRVRTHRGWAAVACGLVLLAPTAAAAAPVLNPTLSGTAKGFALDGKVRFGRVTCVSLSGRGLEVQWSGSAPARKHALEQVSGDMSFQKTGKSIFGPKGTAIASLVVNGDYADRYGSGLPGGTGAATVARNRKSGAIDAVVVDRQFKVRIRGSWACP